MTDDIRYSLAFSMLKNINLDIANQLLLHIGEEKALFTMEPSALSAIGRLPESITDENYRESLLKRAKEEERFIIANDIHPLYFSESVYPSRLLNCNDAPVMLYKLGDLNLDARHVISIVGTRRATHYGIEMTNRIVRQLADTLDDVIIVSGLAYGIDVAAHKAALDCNIPTVAVTAQPLNTIYPADHRGVAVKILREGGAILTEYSTSHEVHRANFLARNRIIAGLSDVTIVVESDSKGGSLVTAALAGEYDREVYAVPGRLTDKYSQGTLNLIASNRAHPYISVEDLISEMRWEPKPQVGEQQTLPIDMKPEEKMIYDFLMENPASRENEIMLATGIPAASLKDFLFGMELKDMIMSIAGGKYTAL